MTQPTFDVTKLENLTEIAGQFVRETPDGAIVKLCGEVGLGKTTFVRACVEQLFPDENLRVLSPSFVLRCQYQKSRIVEHFDFYRFESLSHDDLWNLGYFEALENVQKTKGYLFVEWPEKVADPNWLRPTHELSWRWTASGREVSSRKIQFDAHSG